MIDSWLLALAIAAAPAPSPTPLPVYPLDALLAKPVSPGAVALLVPHLPEERASARVIEALSHADPSVRAVAARVAAITELKAAGPVVRRLLESESDASAATEQIRAVVPLGAAAEDAALIALAARLGLVDMLGDTLAGVRGPAALALWQALREAGSKERFDDAGFVAIATRGGREGLSVAATTALREGDPGLWASVLALARRPGATMSPGLLLAAVQSPKSDLRAGVYWHLALSPGARSPELAAAVAQSPESVSPDTADPAAAFALVVLGRAEKGARFGGDWGERAGSGTPALAMTTAADRALAGLLTKTEARALSLRMTGGHDAEWIARGLKQSPAVVEDQASPGISFAGGLPPGTLRDMMTVTGCQPDARQRATGFVEYRVDGRPRRVSVAEPPSSRGCAEIGTPALSLSILPRRLFDFPAAPGRMVVVIPLNQAALDCVEEPAAPPAERIPGPGELASAPRIKEPRKVKNVAPWYPARALAERRQGVVVLEAIITTSGCVRAARVLGSVSPDLDAVAMIAVGQWTYTPTLLDGKPVPIIMTVTINFKLS